MCVTLVSNIYILTFLGFPAIMVIISLSVTQLKGYGHKEACWLNADKGLIWAFIVPALGVILVSKNTFNLSTFGDKMS